MLSDWIRKCRPTRTERKGRQGQQNYPHLQYIDMVSWLVPWPSATNTSVVPYCPQPIRDASVVITSRQEETIPNGTPAVKQDWDFHLCRACTQPWAMRICQYRWQEGSNRRRLFHTCRGCRWSNPRGITQEAAISILNNLWSTPYCKETPERNWLRRLRTSVIREWDREARIETGSIVIRLNVIDCRGDKQLFTLHGLLRNPAWSHGPAAPAYCAPIEP